MLKRKLLTITLAILLLTTTIEARYNGYAAAWYAREYAKSLNYDYNDYHGIGDCTNFVSQALKYGGLQVNYRGANRYGKYYVWYPDSITWIRSPALRKRFIYGYENVRRVGCQSNFYSRECSSPENHNFEIKVGDVVFLKSLYRRDNERVGKVRWHHTVMVTKVNNYYGGYQDVYFSAHDRDTFNGSINGFKYGRKWILEYWRPY